MHQTRRYCLTLEFSIIISGRSVSCNDTSTRTVPLGNTSPSHRDCQLSGEWQNMLTVRWSPGATSKRVPFSGRPPCDPNIMDPDSDDNKVAIIFASSNCPSSSKRWKRADAWMAEMLPLSSPMDCTWESSGTRPASFFGNPFSWKISAGMKHAGKVSVVLLKSLCPRSQNSVISLEYTSRRYFKMKGTRTQVGG